MFQRRTFVLGLLAAVAATAPCTSALAETFPAKPVTIVAGSASGSTTDGLARIIGEQITLKTGQPVVIQNNPGASGAIAANEVARASPDGDTVFMTTNTTQSANPYLFKHLAYDPVNDFAPVGLLVKGYLILVIHPSVKADNVSALIAEARRKPNALSYGSGSSSARVAAELFQQMTGTQLNALFTAAVKTAPVLKFIEINGMEPSTSSAKELVKFQADELVRWGKIIRAAGIEPE